MDQISKRDDQVRALRRRVYEIMEIGHGEDRASRVFDIFIVTLIMLNVAAFVAETVPSLYAAYGPFFFAFELFSVAVFTVEYLLRLWTAVEMPFLKRLNPVSARLYSATRPSLIIDLLAILPFYLSQFFALDGCSAETIAHSTSQPRFTSWSPRASASIGDSGPIVSQALNSGAFR